MGLEWKIYDNNFDNIFNAMLSLFVLSTFDNWYETMNIAINSHNEDEVKKKPLKRIKMIIFFFFKRISLNANNYYF